MRKRFGFLAIPVVVIAAAAVFWFFGRGASTPTVGRPAPAFQLPSLAGKDLALNDFRGHPVVINFWATWCVPCKEEMPELQAAAKSHPELVVLGVDNAESAAKVRPFVQKLGLSFPILLDTDANVIDQYRIVGTPTSFFVDKDGVTRSIYLGAMNEDTLKKNLATIGIS